MQRDYNLQLHARMQRWIVDLPHRFRVQLCRERGRGLLLTVDQEDLPRIPLDG